MKKFFIVIGVVVLVIGGIYTARAIHIYKLNHGDLRETYMDLKHGVIEKKNPHYLNGNPNIQVIGNEKYREQVRSGYDGYPHR